MPSDSPEMPDEAGLRRRVDHLFRQQAGEMVAALTRIFGVERLELAEDVVQEALLEALRRWRYTGVPDNPAGWLVRVARNRALDAIRRRGTLAERESELERWAREAERASIRDAAAPPVEEIRDDALRMMFTCCHEDLAETSRVALTLKILCGFGVPEISRAFLTPEPTIAQRLVRAKRRLRDLHPEFELPAPEDLPARLDSVMGVLYLVFNEGYASHRGPDLVRSDLVRESIRLTKLLLDHPATAQPKVHALLALMLFQGARLPARVGALGELLILEEQDRTQWDAGMIRAGFAHLERARAGEELSAVHLEAAIAAVHAQATRYDRTDWTRILELYDLLMDLHPTPVVALNRAVAVACVEGDEAGLRALEAIEGHRSMREYYLLPATRGELCRRLGRKDEAARCFREALGCAGSEPERSLLEQRLASCRASE